MSLKESTTEDLLRRIDRKLAIDCTQGGCGKKVTADTAYKCGSCCVDNIKQVYQAKLE